MIQSIAPEYLHKISQGGFLRAALNNHAVHGLIDFITLTYRHLSGLWAHAANAYLNLQIPAGLHFPISSVAPALYL